MLQYYDLPDSHKSLLQAEGLCGRIYNHLCIMMNFEQDNIDPVTMEEAINKAIIRFPSTRLRTHNFKEGKKTVIKQYFVDEPDSKCQVLSFKDDKKMYKFINKMVKTPFPNKYQDCDLYRIYLIKRANGRYSMLVCFYHMVADAYAIIKFSNDVFNVYSAMKNGTEMPKTLEPLQPIYEDRYNYKNSPRYAKDIEFWNNYWNKVTLPQFSTFNGIHDTTGAYIPGKKYGNFLNIFNVKATQSNYKISKELNQKINDFAAKYDVSVKMLYLMGLKTYLSKQNNKIEEFMLLDNLAHRSKKNELNTGGSLTEATALYLDAKNSMTVAEACKYTSISEMEVYKHSNLHQEKMMTELDRLRNYDKMFDKGWVRGNTSFIFTYQAYFTAPRDDFKISIERFTTGKSPMPVYITIMPTDNYSGEMNVNYEYMTKIHKEEDVAKFHSFLVKFLDKATSNPDMTLEDLMEV